MNDSKNLAVGVLSITAVILFVGILLMGRANEARAIGQTDRGGDYIVVTGQFSDSQEVVYVADAAANRLNMYGYDWNRGIIILWDAHDLNRDLGRGAGPTPRK